MLRPRTHHQVAENAFDWHECLAKTTLNAQGLKQAGCGVHLHSLIVGAVAKEIVKRYPDSLGKVLFPIDVELLSALHDIGKVSPTFQKKLLIAIDEKTYNNKSREKLLQLNNVSCGLEKQWGGHAGVSYLTLKALDAPSYIPEIVGCHHGFLPPVVHQGKIAKDESFGGVSWQKEREKLVDQIKKDLFISEWPEIESDSQARLVAGLTTVVDWIGSGSFFDHPDAQWSKQISEAVDHAGFIPAEYQHDLSFKEVFGFETRPVQQAFIEQVSSPGIYLLEAPMGLGKTEAALYAAYRMLESQQATGIYFALPTQLTSNKIYERFNGFLKKVLSDDCKHRSLLVHSHAWLLEKTELGVDGQPGGEWFNQNKRALLAPFGVGTVDQALMAAMNVKHGFVRAFGLAGKVVILDEVHSYDAYTGTILDALVALLRSLHCTVIILTATLSRERREALLGCSVQREDYPLITSMSDNQGILETHVALPAGNEVIINRVEDPMQAIEEALHRAEMGQQVLWIENTVGEAQQCYLNLAARCQQIGVKCGLLHSRFTAYDREQIEEVWVNLYGKNGWGTRGAQGRILIGTQVLEQSLDLDADFLISRFAPTDMLLQRIGRLWRHSDTPRAESAQCETWVIAPSSLKTEENPSKHFGATAWVYSPYVLCRSLEVWREVDHLSLPADIRVLIEKTYLTRSETESMSKLHGELINGTRHRKGTIAMQQLASLSLSRIGKTLSDRNVQTRYSEADSQDVLVLKRIKSVPGEFKTRITLLSGKTVEIPWKQNHLTKKEWRGLSAELMRHVVSVRVHESPAAVSRNQLEKLHLHRCFYLGSIEHDEALLRVVQIDESDCLTGLDGGSAHSEYELLYRNDLGYRLTKPKE